jgi:hypothetical protein
MILTTALRSYWNAFKFPKTSNSINDDLDKSCVALTLSMVIDTAAREGTVEMAIAVSALKRQSDRLYILITGRSCTIVKQRSTESRAPLRWRCVGVLVGAAKTSQSREYYVARIWTPACEVWISSASPMFALILSIIFLWDIRSNISTDSCRRC